MFVWYFVNVLVLLGILVMTNSTFVISQETNAGVNETIRDDGVVYLKKMDFRNIRLISFTICRSDPECARRFFIDGQAFDINLFRYFFDRFVVETDSREYLENTFASDLVKQSWLYTMRQASFCTDNEVADSDGYCVCKNGKVCHEESSSVFNIDVASFNFVFVVLLIATIYYSAVHLSEFRTIHDNVIRLKQYYKTKNNGKPSNLVSGNGIGHEQICSDSIRQRNTEKHHRDKKLNFYE